MYPMQCLAGFPMPLLAGKYEVYGFSCSVTTSASTSQIAFLDDETIKADDKFGKLIPLTDIYNGKVLLIDIKNIASLDKNISYEFAEPIKVRHGLSMAADNIVGGSICVYRR
jgi:hypothetical protein